MPELMSNSSDKLSHAASMEDFSESYLGVRSCWFPSPKSSGFKSGEEGGHVSLDQSAMLSAHNFWHLVDVGERVPS
uniref:Uncharacterized protein n=1 Tax=Lepeophtheirus salmonis TaxID=72036 RepID=A0A0K2U263_LEPSM